jgi:hypothetical protein
MYIGLFQKRFTLCTGSKFRSRLLYRWGGVSVGGLTSNFLCGGSMDVFWNDPFN